MICLTPQLLTPLLHPPQKKESPRRLTQAPRKKKGASTYSPALSRSTIGAGGLNCSVRNGKRWNTAAIDTRNVT